jgi:hypothetical protein
VRQSANTEREGEPPRTRCRLVTIRIYAYTEPVTAPPHKILYSVRLEPEQVRLLKVVKARDGVPESEQIRRALMVWFEEKGVLPAKKRKS